MTTRIDHLVYAAGDIQEAVLELHQRLGVRALDGGQHPGRGTRNAIIALSSESYLEIVGPDPAQPPTESPRWFGIDSVTFPHLVTWAVKSTDLDAIVARAARKGVTLGAVTSGSRQRPDGTRLQWRFTDPTAMICDGLVPFFIDWGTSTHPAASASPGPALLSLRAEHPAPSTVMSALLALGVDLPVARGPRPRLIATIETSSGPVTLV
jgi:hypothetical protein